MPKPRKRPRDPLQLAKLIGDIATGQVAEDRRLSGDDDTVNKLARRGGLKGGKARADKLSADRRSKIARLAASARWKKSN
jgi:hypothetical protein